MSIRLSRSQIESRQKCPALDYWTYRYGGLGVQRAEHALPLVAGIHTHETLALVLQGHTVEEALAQVIPAYRSALMDRGVVGIEDEFLLHLAYEQSALLEGLVRGWVKFRLPLLLDEFTIVSVEEETEWPLSGINEGVVVQMRLDALLRHRFTGELHVLDFKTVSYPGTRWQSAFEHSLQTILYTAGMEATHPGESVAGVLYEGLCTGGRRAQETGRWPGRKTQQSPLVYGCGNADLTELQTAYTSKKGWHKVGVWETPLTPLQWLEDIVSEQEWRDLYWHVPTIRPTADELGFEVEQLLREELVQQERLAALPPADDVNHWASVQRRVPRHRMNCLPWDGAKCPCYELCYDRAVGEAPLLSGLYQVREPHHPHAPLEGASDSSISVQ